MIAQFRHDHVMPILATFKWKDRYYFMFPRANSNLAEYWQHNPRPVLETGLIQWVAGQFTGIPDAIANLYVQRQQIFVGKDEGLSIRLKDIGPEHIFLFDSLHDERGILVASFDVNLNLSMGRTGILSTSPAGSYGAQHPPPEWGDRIGLNKQEKESDMWSLGCVYLSMITWLVGGTELLEEFEAKRSRQASSVWVMSDSYYEVSFPPSGKVGKYVTSQTYFEAVV